MKSLTQGFFWKPSEILSWLKTIASRPDVWLVLREAGKSAEKVKSDFLSEKILCGRIEESIQFFLGAEGTSSLEWERSDERQDIDFAKSYVILLTPSLFGPDGYTLLQGRIAILASSGYEDFTRYRKLVNWYNELRTDMKRESDSERCIVQELSNGRKKVWKSILLGKEVPEDGTLKLKQFYHGTVTFRIENS